ncbi:hypothetical protein Glove_323g6 [Diversispora epigaea]|uniref:Uncharacterized protein n=1 Tax=Diversispora epigaea TaxID=1348612 RepID=A0A397HSH8_9GLOM|nr:hypothetical protein Glove_323g6 [Diversispora epigaea]
MPVLSTLIMATTMCLVSGSLILIDGLFYITFNKKNRTDKSNLLSINSGFLGPFFTSKSTKTNKCNQKFSLPSNDGNNTCQNCGQQSAIIIEKLKAALMKEVKTLGTPPVDHSVESLGYNRNFKLTSSNKNYNNNNNNNNLNTETKSTIESQTKSQIKSQIKTTKTIKTIKTPQVFYSLSSSNTHNNNNYNNNNYYYNHQNLYAFHFTLHHSSLHLINYCQHRFGYFNDNNYSNNYNYNYIVNNGDSNKNMIDNNNNNNDGRNNKRILNRRILYMNGTMIRCIVGMLFIRILLNLLRMEWNR